MRGRSCPGPGMDVRGQLVKGSSLLPQCGIQGMDLVLRLGSKLPLPAEPSPGSPSFFFFKVYRFGEIKHIHESCATISTVYLQNFLRP